MRHVPGPHRQIYKNYLKLAEFVGERLRLNKETLDPNNPRDFIDCFLIKLEQVSLPLITQSAALGRSSSSRLVPSSAETSRGCPSAWKIWGSFPSVLSPKRWGGGGGAPGTPVP